ncbi:hypothetical protein [Paracoccus sphaerophysae]|uniref:hypothetical protein n=1 Tax=Paracoccus sphaerophysae TaxID=690417 RepID=UPI0023524794|nr:hypothetical protein [Paracoccus sphaerophysae]
MDDFAARYFRARKQSEPFDWARRNLAEEATHDARRTVPWRYAILRMHEPVEGLVEQMSDADRARFEASLKPVFVDNYAAVPPESIRRLLALHDAGLLSIRAIGSDWTMQQSDEGTTLDTAAGPLTFEVFVDARGQKPLEADDLPFPTLRASLLTAGVDVLDVDEDYRLLGAPAYDARVYMGAIPYLMHDRPFVQGITAACDIGTRIGGAVLREALETSRRRRGRVRWEDFRPRLPRSLARLADPVPDVAAG